MLVGVGVFGEGLALSSVALIRLGSSAADVALATAGLAACALVAAASTYYTTAGLQVRAMPVDPAAVPRWATRLVALNTWDQHWEDTSAGSQQFKRRFMLFIDGLRLPWWTAAELSAALIQGCILGVRMNLEWVCRAQLWALTAHSAIVLAAAAYFRPCGARLGNVFLLLSKLGAFTTAALNLAAILTDNEALSGASESVTAAFTAIAAAQTVLDVVCQLLALVASKLAAAPSSSSSSSSEKAAPLLCVDVESSEATVAVGIDDAPPPTGDATVRELWGPTVPPPLAAAHGAAPAPCPPLVIRNSSGDPLLTLTFGVSERTRRRAELLHAARRLLRWTLDERARHGRFPTRTPEQAWPALETLINCAASSRELNIMQGDADQHLL
jgi:hypothetical protein